MPPLFSRRLEAEVAFPHAGRARSEKRWWIGWTAAVATALAGCASEPGRGTYGGDEVRGEHGRAALNLFISPAGKPFRGGPDAPYAVALWFAGADTDHDGRLTLSEFRADALAFFHELDANHDGVIDGFEVQDYEQRIAPEILPRLEGLHADEGMDPALLHGGRGRRSGGDAAAPRPQGRVQAGDRRPEGAGLYSVLNEPEPVASADSDFSGRITPEEWLAKADARFRLLDASARGYLTLDALPHTAAQDLLEKLRRRDAKRRAGPSGRS